MSKKEAIQTLYAVKDELVERHFEFNGHVSAPITAIDMAIEALSAEQVTGKLKNSDNSLLEDDPEDHKEQKSKLDLISRQDAIEALAKVPGVGHRALDAVRAIPSIDMKVEEV